MSTLSQTNTSLDSTPVGALFFNSGSIITPSLSILRNKYDHDMKFTHSGMNLFQLNELSKHYLIVWIAPF
ncbi:hypothetical protein [Pleionea sp. CnH1-48]|uniref:hypothetical protein n=1 Tax=Pleionea sp. CnH1-48 TaxID=2954494 RepID=UPI002097FA0E|nr:hypothetical protein [Pleionea sp. CnH1-48]MCO7225210.1 hypothetical protein [Pleionea sp. CnH1-48]